jgi:hypothetical protein
MFPEIELMSGGCHVWKWVRIDRVFEVVRNIPGVRFFGFSV